MSKLTLEVPSPVLRWWRLRLPLNDGGNVMTLSHDGVYEGGRMVTPPSAVTYEFFDGIDAQIKGVVACGTERIGHRYFLLLLCDHRPTLDPGWEPLDPVILPHPPFRDSQGQYDDIPLFTLD